ncbi:MAG: ABC transporter ATP-binding protein, partial [Clostridia bacterium]|nr:ABC transporter ATP-binding protein [Clostridia bacterium]
MIQISHLTKTYKSKQGTKVALDIPQLTLPDTGMIFLSGKSGSGKSTFINLIGGLDNVSSGDVVVDGVNIAKLNETELTKYRSSITTYIFQDYYLLPQLNVYENINLLLSQEEHDPHRIEEIIRRTGLEEHVHKKTNELSGGERQRVAIARALAKRPKILLCDEPTGNLDEENSNAVLSILKELSKDILIIVVSHKRYECETFGDTILYLEDGKIKGFSNDKLDAIQPREVEGAKLVQNRVPAINTLKLFGAFLKNKVGSSAFMLVMIALLLSLFFVIQSFLSFNTGEAVKQSIYDDG